MSRAAESGRKKYNKPGSCEAAEQNQEGARWKKKTKHITRQPEAVSGKCAGKIYESGQQKSCRGL